MKHARIATMAFVLVMLFSLAIPTPASAALSYARAFEDGGGGGGGDIIVIRPSLGGSTTATPLTLESMFKNGSKQFDYRLAQYCMLANEAKQNPATMATFFANNGFETKNIYNASETISADSIGFSIGSRTVNINGVNRPVILAVLQGTRGPLNGPEWGSDANVGLGDFHCGFYRAASTVYSQLTKMPYYNDSNTIICITGFSRGAATANILATMVKKQNNTYVYTFAAANTAKRGTVRGAGDVYQNVFNIMDNSDLVTMPVSGSDMQKTFGFLSTLFNLIDPVPSVARIGMNIRYNTYQTPDAAHSIKSYKNYVNGLTSNSITITSAYAEAK